MNAKEFLQMADLMAGFNSAMKGELKAETETAKQALAELGDAKQIADNLAEWTKRKDEIDAYHEEMAKKLQEHIDQANLAKKASDDSAAKAQLLLNTHSANSAALSQAQAKHDADKKAWAKQQEIEYATLEEKTKQANTLLNEAGVRKGIVDAKESELNAKIQAMKAAVG